MIHKGVLSAEILCSLTSAGSSRHFVILAKANAKWEHVEGAAEDGVVAMRASPQARKKCPSLPEVWHACAITVIDQGARKHILLTSLIDRMRYKAGDIAACYARRWHIETSYRELKQTVLGMALTLRSKTVDGVSGDPGALTAYNLIRLEMAKAAFAVKCEPTEISFVRAFHVIQYELHWAVTRAYGKLPVLFERRTARSTFRPSRQSLPQRYTVRVLKKDLN